LVTPQKEGGLGKTPTRNDKKALRESASTLLTDKSKFKKATNLEKAAAVKTLVESDQPLSPKEIKGIGRALTVIDLNRLEDSSFIKKLVAKAPGLKTYFATQQARLDELEGLSGRESASSLLTDKSKFKEATNLEKAAAVKTLVESDQPLSPEEIKGIGRAIPVIDLNPRQRPEDSSFIEKLVAKAPSLATYFGFSTGYAIKQARSQGTLPQLPTKELEGIFDDLKSDDITKILEEGSAAQKAKMVELALKKKFNIELKPDIDVSVIEKDPSKASEILTKLHFELARNNPDAILAKLEDLPKEEKQNRLNLWNKMIESTR